MSTDFAASQHDHDCTALASRHRDEFPDACEYNPTHKRAAFSCEGHASAVLLVGSKGKWRLCAECAGLPEFRRFRARQPIVHKR